MHLILLFWYCYDDHLADALNIPGLAHVPIYIWMISVAGNWIVMLLSDCYCWLKRNRKEILRRLNDR